METVLAVKMSRGERKAFFIQLKQFSGVEYLQAESHRRTAKDRQCRIDSEKWTVKDGQKVTNRE